MAAPTPVTSNVVTGIEDPAPASIAVALSPPEVPSGGTFTITATPVGIADGATLYLQGASGASPPSPLPYIPGNSAVVAGGVATFTFVTPPNPAGSPPLPWAFDVTNVAPPA